MQNVTLFMQIDHFCFVDAITTLGKNKFFLNMKLESRRYNIPLCVHHYPCLLSMYLDLFLVKGMAFKKTVSYVGFEQ